MKVTDLTQVIKEDMQVFPGTEQPRLTKAYSFEENGFRETKITMYSHTGTHVDAPAHMLSQGACLEELQIEKFIGRAIVLDFSNKAMALIDVEALQPYEKEISKVEFIILNTGWSKYWGKEEYYKGFPVLTEAAALWLSKFNLKGIGLDAISIDEINSTECAIHKILLEKNYLLIENLTNLESINKGFFLLSVMPLKYKNADGAPARVVAIEDL